MLDFISVSFDEPKDMPRGAFLQVNLATYTRTSNIHKDLQLIDLPLLNRDLVRLARALFAETDSF